MSNFVNHSGRNHSGINHSGINHSGRNLHGRNYAGQSGKIGMGCLIAILVVVALAAGGGYLAYNKFRDMMGEEILAAIKSDPAILEHIGDVQSFELDMAATGQETEALKEKNELPEDSTVFVFQVVGSKGKGSLAVIMGPDDVAAAMDSKREGGATFSGASLTMDGGQVYPLEPRLPKPKAVPADTPVEKPPEAVPGDKPAEAPADDKSAPEKK